MWLAQALSDSAGSPLEMFSVRGDGLTTATTDKTDVSAFVATASVAAYSGTVMEVQTTGTTAGSGFMLFHVGVGSGRGVVPVLCLCVCGRVCGGSSVRCFGEGCQADCVACVYVCVLSWLPFCFVLVAWVCAVGVRPRRTRRRRILRSRCGATV